MNETEELIKAALAKGAERAPHPGQIINALNTPRRRSRPALLAIVGAVVVIAAITVPIAFRTPAANAPAPPATQYTPLPATSVIPMKYKPADIPAGYVEVSRRADLDGGHQNRNWMNGNDRAFHISVHTPRSPQWSAVSQSTGNQPVQIGGITGWLSGPSDDTVAELRWLADKDTAIVVQAYVQGARALATRVARSVVPDGVAFVRPPLSFGRLPDRLNRIEVEVFGGSPAAAGTVLRASVNGSETGYVQARIVPAGTVDRDGWTVLAPLADGRQVELAYTVDAGLTGQQAQDIVNAVKVEQQPDFSWVGK
jgi:hypothetical protein